jgi:L-asparaginase II
VPSRTEAALVVELRRGPLPESTHRVHAVVVDTAGRLVRAWGDPDRPVHPRSAVKPLQALPLVETGAADAFGVSEIEMALACASHEGEPGHVQAVRSWLARIGSSVDDLECGPQERREHGPVGNNCSGKHAGFLTVCRHLGIGTSGYVRPDHPVQQLVTAALAETTGHRLDPALAGTDGCGIPVHPVPLRALGLAAALLGRPGEAWPSERASAAHRLTGAMTSHPWYVAGTGRLVTDLMAAAGGDIVAKDGAEGVQLVALRSHGLGIAVKAEGGHGPASEVALGHVLSLVEGAERSEVFGPRRELRNHAGDHVADLVVR